MAADFAFAIDKTPSHAEMYPVYAALLGPDKRKPTLSLGAVSRAEASAWLAAQHASYIRDIGSRSGLLKKIDLAERVELVDLGDAP